MAEENSKIGIIGLGVMGLSLARNMKSKGHNIMGYDPNETARAAARKYGLSTSDTMHGCIAALEQPRRILIMVPSGEPVDAVLKEIGSLLDEGDSVADGGNSYFEDTTRREREWAAKGIHYLGLGVSGGRRGALEGPGMMAGGSKVGYALWQDVLESIAARYMGEICVAYLGTGGAGHYVKMVHNGIEYAMMQVLAEAYILLKENEKHDQDTIGQIFKAWNKGALAGYLTGITADILSKKDASGRYWIDQIRDNAKQKGTGTWTVKNALELGVPVPGIDAAVRERQISAHFEHRHNISKGMHRTGIDSDRSKTPDTDKIRNAVYAAQLLNYIQGFHLLARAKESYGYTYFLREIAAIWRGGCIISSEITAFLGEQIMDGIPHPLLVSSIRDAVIGHVGDLSHIVLSATANGLPVPAMSADLNYLNSYTNTDLPTNLIQAQRDYFGGHGLELKSGKKTNLNWEESTS